MLRTIATEDENDDECGHKSIVADSTYLKFWEEFGKSIKLGVIEDQKNRRRLKELLRFPTSKSPDIPISLSQYVDRMNTKQEYIFYIIGDSIEEVEALMDWKKLYQDDMEVLHFVHRLDRYLSLGEYDEYEFKPIFTMEQLKEHTIMEYSNGRINRKRTDW